MEHPVALTSLMVLLIGNYPADQQQSMQRFAMMMLDGLTAAGVPAELIQPQPFLVRMTFAGSFIAKWLGYLDKFVFFPWRLRRKARVGVDLVHICDHSNAMYGPMAQKRPVLVTCHDLLAVRGALGEATDCPPSATGKYLQRWIVSGLRKADAVACASPATLRDAQRIIGEGPNRPRLSLIHHGLNFPYCPQERSRSQALLEKIRELDLQRPFVLHVGSNLRMKNREGVLRIFGLTKDRWDGQLVFAGQKLSPELRSLGQDLGISDRLIEIEGPPNELLEALYSRAVALLYPSRFEGFGWPIIEAQACGCPVICSDQEPMSEVGGEAALTGPVEDEAAMAQALLKLLDPAERAHWSEKSLRNAERFRAEVMIARYLELYRSLGAAV